MNEYFIITNKDNEPNLQRISRDELYSLIKCNTVKCLTDITNINNLKENECLVIKGSLTIVEIEKTIVESIIHEELNNMIKAGFGKVPC